MIELIQSKIAEIIVYLPFVATTKDGKPHLNTARVIESLLISAIVAVASSFMTIQALNIQFSSMKEEQRVTRTTLDDIKKDLYILKGKVEK